LAGRAGEELRGVGQREAVRFEGDTLPDVLHKGNAARV
jgi:hypothetical protein